MKQVDVLGIAGALAIFGMGVIAVVGFFLIPWLIYRDYKSDVDTKHCIKRKVNNDKWEVKKAVQYCNATN